MSQVRIACTSNYDSEVFTESFVNVPLMWIEKAWQIYHILNSIDPNGKNYYKPVPIDYVLYKFEP